MGWGPELNKRKEEEEEDEKEDKEENKAEHRPASISLCFLAPDPNVTTSCSSGDVPPG